MMSDGALLCVGQAALDHVFRIEQFSAAGGKAVASEQDSRIGGMAARAALAAHSLRRPGWGTDIRLLSAVGDDAAGKLLQRALRAKGLDVACVSGARTPVSAVLVDARGDRQVTNFRGDALQRARLPELPCAVHGVLVDPRWPEAATQALAHARRLGVPAVLDADVADTAVLRRLVPLVGWCVFSHGGLSAWAGELVVAPCAALERAAQAAPHAELLVTLGGDGALWRRHDGRMQALPAMRVEVHDTTGAGDVMHGALLLALAEGQPAEQAVRFAMTAATLACRGATPARTEIDQLIGAAA